MKTMGIVAVAALAASVATVVAKAVSMSPFVLAVVRTWHEAGGFCSAAFLPLLNEVQTELAQVRTGSL
jgi:hypothetical protein